MSCPMQTIYMEECAILFQRFLFRFLVSIYIFHSTVYLRFVIRSSTQKLIVASSVLSVILILSVVGHTSQVCLVIMNTDISEFLPTY
jgi:hypothetical protein